MPFTAAGPPPWKKLLNIVVETLQLIAPLDVGFSDGSLGMVCALANIALKHTQANNPMTVELARRAVRKDMIETAFADGFAIAPSLERMDIRPVSGWERRGESPETRRIERVYRNATLALLDLGYFVRLPVIS